LRVASLNKYTLFVSREHAIDQGKHTRHEVLSDDSGIIYGTIKDKVVDDHDPVAVPMASPTQE